MLMIDQAKVKVIQDWELPTKDRGNITPWVGKRLSTFH